jgi:hypothetical protein
VHQCFFCAKIHFLYIILIGLNSLNNYFCSAFQESLGCW